MPNDYAHRLRALIDEHGHAVQHVLGDRDTFAFSYTVGLCQEGQGRELVTIGLPPGVAESLLNALAGRLATPGELPAQVSGVATVPLRLRQIPAHPLGFPLSAHRLLGVSPPAALVQVLWPCPAGHWPGDPAYSHPCPQDPLDLRKPPFH
jgi:hypothetical protein